MNVLRAAANLYKEQVRRIIIVDLLFVLPLQLAHMFASNYFYTDLQLKGAAFFGDLLNALLLLIAVSLAQIPFIYMAIRTIDGEVFTLKEVIGSFFKNMLPVYLFSLLYVFFIALGFFALVIPGLIVLILLYTFPYVIVISKEKGWGVIKKSYVIGKTNFFRLLGVILAFGAMEGILGIIALWVSLQITSSYLIVSLVQMGVNLVVLPLFTFVMTYKLVAWKAAQAPIETELVMNSSGG